ncbi:Conserved membrane protein in copper uptake, YcnI [Alloactinosynnema sp. L-07]|uniref:YcnI family copper-binding membrane protein n=1 Tax=Alloactinosynnema sp. L-07 TaxID=1653480 RepID=UPI00065EF4D0|nr:YcnI family protein [Alloactinosynnema sp. L-07]CRK60764.1 Conserved membrane protein in copper uptake, YcnI [Alloactinosynnema sp. L-07]
MSHRFLARAGVLLAVAGSAALFSTGVASAHVTAKVIGEPAVQGGYTKITFRVPNEDNAAGTVKLEIKFPAEYPLTSVRTKPLAGWTAAITKTKLDKPVTSHGTEITEAVSTVTFTAAAGTRIGPGEFGEFEVSAGRLPDNTETLVIPTVQTYDSGKVVAWDAPPPAAGAEEPERPAPVVKLTKKAAGSDVHGAAQASNETAAEGDAHGEAKAARSDNTARWLGGAGLAVGALGLGLGAGATLRARKAIAKAGE